MEVLISGVTPVRIDLAIVLLAVLVAGGSVLPTVHLAAHGLEVAAERVAHVATFHDGVALETGTDQAQPPCSPRPHGVDCAICVGLSVVVGHPEAGPYVPDGPEGAETAYANWIRTHTATGAGARAPPVG